MNGMGQLLANCIYAFPEKYEEYIKDKAKYKHNLEQYMIALKDKLENVDRRKNFFYKAVFNAGEVNYLTVKHNDKFHIFYNIDVVETFGERLTVENSIARNAEQFSNQKTVFKLNGKNFAEIEMRNDSVVHYREVRFNMLKVPAIELLMKEIQPVKEFNEKVLLYGQAIKKFEKSLN